MVTTVFLIAEISIHCETVPSPAHGSVVVQGNAAGGTLATYSCHADYHLLGDYLRECDNSRGWSGEEPTCECCHGNYPNILFDLAEYQGCFNCIFIFVWSVTSAAFISFKHQMTP